MIWVTPVFVRPADRTVLDLSRVLFCAVAAKEMIREAVAERTRQGGRLEVMVAG